MGNPALIIYPNKRTDQRSFYLSPNKYRVCFKSPCSFAEQEYTKVATSLLEVVMWKAHKPARH